MVNMVYGSRRESQHVSKKGSKMRDCGSEIESDSGSDYPCLGLNEIIAASKKEEIKERQPLTKVQTKKDRKQHPGFHRGGHVATLFYYHRHHSRVMTSGRTQKCSMLSSCSPASSFAVYLSHGYIDATLREATS